MNYQYRHRLATDIANVLLQDLTVGAIQAEAPQDYPEGVDEEHLDLAHERIYQMLVFLPDYSLVANYLTHVGSLPSPEDMYA